MYHRTKRRCKKQIVIIRHLTIQENSSKEKRGRKRSRKELWQCWEKRNNWESRRGFKAQRQDDTVNKLTSPHWMSPRRWVRILCSWCRREREREKNGSPNNSYKQIFHVVTMSPWKHFFLWHDVKCNIFFNAHSKNWSYKPGHESTAISMSQFLGLKSDITNRGQL